MTLFLNKRHIFVSALTCSLFFAGCGSDENTDPNATDDVPTEENAVDYPGVPVSDACGGKCDNPNAALYSSSARLINTLDMTNYENTEGETETFRLVAEVIEDEYLNVEDGQTLTVELYAMDGMSNPEFKITAELTYQEDGIGGFISEGIDTSELLPWLLLRADVTGTYGEQEITQSFDFSPGFEAGFEVLPEFEDPFAPARDVDAGAIFFDDEVAAPESYDYPNVDGPFGLGGTEFWQRWTGGLNPTFSFTAGTDLGRKCMQASAIRFETIMADPPEALVQLREETNWSGRFFNWNDDFSHEDATRRPTGAVLWAWRTGLVKWISQTGEDGTCYLPTRGMVERAAANCLEKGQENDGEIEGCQAW